MPSSPGRPLLVGVNGDNVRSWIQRSTYCPDWPVVLIESIQAAQSLPGGVTSVAGDDQLPPLARAAQSTVTFSIVCSRIASICPFAADRCTVEVQAIRVPSIGSLTPTYGK